MAVQFAKAMSAEIYVFSTSPNKKDLADKMWVHHFIDMSNEESVKSANSKLDLILNTSPALIDFPKYYNFLKNDGTLVLLGIQQGKIKNFFFK